MEVDHGYERDRLDGRRGLPIRWWLYVALDGAEGRPQRPRLGVVDHGFRFARGGRVRTDDAAQAALRAAYEEANRELGFWRGQPSHRLGPNGELIPLGELAPELPAGRVELRS